jgi:hypothetical protein
VGRPRAQEMDLGDEVIALDPALLSFQGRELNGVASRGQGSAYLEDGSW